MPHFTIEYAAPIAKDVNVQNLVEDVFKTADRSGLFSRSAIKARALCVENYWIGGGSQSFVHVHVRLLPGRTTDQKKALSQSVFETIAGVVSKDVAISIEVNDLDAETYTKRA